MTTTRGPWVTLHPKCSLGTLGACLTELDIYSFRILFLEMVGGRKNVGVTMENTSQIYFQEWIYNM